MKVLFITRPTVFTGPGGDTVQLQNTAAALGKVGVSVDIATEISPNFATYDLVHFFNLRNPQDLLHNVRRAHKYGIPTALSTIWGSYLEGDIATRTGLQGFVVRNFPEHSVEYVKVIARMLFNANFHPGMIEYFLSGHYSAQREICDLIDVLLPNSPTELDRVRNDMSIPKKFGVVVHNAVDRNIFDYEKVQPSDDLMKYSNFVVSVARIEPRKCQLELIQACNLLGEDLLIIGSPSRNSQAYYKKCRAIAGSNVHFLEQLDHAKISQILKICAVHALVSWMETPGLSSLEAAAMGCNLVVTEKGDTRFYFNENAEYVDPNSVVSIADGIRRASKKNQDPHFRKFVVENFNWDVAARQTLAGYEYALNEA